MNDAMVESIVRTSMAALEAVEGRLEEGTQANEEATRESDFFPQCFADIFGSSFGQAVPSYVMTDSAVFASANGL